MRKLLLTTAAMAIGSALAGEPALGTFDDKRDGTIYKTATIGKQTWMAENLNYQTESGSWCYENKTDNCKKYGRLYYWNTAKTACPAGWKLPDTADWNRLMSTVNGEAAGKKLKSKSGWNKNGNGTDVFGFSALPGGYRYNYGDFYYAGDDGIWWTATERGDSYAYYRNIYHGSNDVDEGISTRASDVRCVA
jgi:uncharacterized protein (TIGR02145 family)